MYIYIYGSDQVSAMHPTLPQITLGKEKKKKKKIERKKEEEKTKEKKCVIYFMHVCTSKKTF